MTTLGFVVTCKGRLQHLSQSLPRLATQAASECVLVDYDCPEHCGEWAGEYTPAVRVVQVQNAPYFSVAHARNLGARAISSPWICFTDADILLQADFAAQITPQLRPGLFYRPSPMSCDMWGTHICHRDDFFRAGGYDEVLQGWGGEDDDLYYRFASLGLKQGFFSGTALEAIRHGDEDRTRHHAVKDKWSNQRINTLYLQLKYDIAQQLKVIELSAETRQTLYTEVRRSVGADIAAGRSESRFEINLPDSSAIPLAPGWAIRRQMVYVMGPVNTGQGAKVSASSSAHVDAYFSSHTVRKLQIGCGNHPLPGWLNTDLQPIHPDIMALDARKPLPFPDDSFDFVFSEHVIEHMSFPEGCAMLAECKRILKPGGRIRIATPDLAFLVGLYGNEKNEDQQRFLQWSKDCFLPWAPSADDTFVINNAVRDWGHQFIYDEKVLLFAMAKAGFTQLVCYPLMESDVADLCGLEHEQRAPAGLLALETMIVEGSRG